MWNRYMWKVYITDMKCLSIMDICEKYINYICEKYKNYGYMWKVYKLSNIRNVLLDSGRN